MKKLIMFLALLCTTSVFASEFASKLKSCDFGFATTTYELVDLSDVPMEKGIYVYFSKTKQVIMDIELPFEEIPALVESKRNKIIITYPIMNDAGELEINQSITILMEKVIESNDEQVSFGAVLNTLGLKDNGVCRFSL